MKWTVLSDNRTCNDLLQTEHGLSILLETEKHRILLDTGVSVISICCTIILLLSLFKNPLPKWHYFDCAKLIGDGV